MNTLLAKDLRLSLDALRPWGLLLLAAVGVAAIGVAISGPAEMRALSAEARFLTELAKCLTLTSGVVAAWIAACVLHGEQRHRADAFTGALPLGRTRRALTKVLAIVAAFFDRELRRGCGGVFGLLSSLFAESVLSALLAPVTMLTNSPSSSEMAPAPASAKAPTKPLRQQKEGEYSCRVEKRQTRP